MKFRKMKLTKYGVVVDSSLRIATTPMHTNKQLIANQWMDVVNILFNFDPKEKDKIKNF